MSGKLQNALRKIACHGCSDADLCCCWTQEDGEWVCHGEPSDGVPDWRISITWDGYLVIREIGWYVQRGDARDDADLLRVAAAMDAASRVFNAALGDDR